MITKIIGYKQVKNELAKDDELSIYVLKLLKNTGYSDTTIKNLDNNSINLAYKFAKTNTTIMNEVGIPFTPLYKTSLLRRSLDMKFVELCEKYSA